MTLLGRSKSRGKWEEATSAALSDRRVVMTGSELNLWAVRLELVVCLLVWTACSVSNVVVIGDLEKGAGSSGLGLGHPVYGNSVNGPIVDWQQATERVVLLGE